MDSYKIEDLFCRMRDGFRSLSGNPNLGVWEFTESSNFIFAIPLRHRLWDPRQNYEFKKGLQFYIEDSRINCRFLVGEALDSGKAPIYRTCQLFEVKVLVDNRGNLSCEVPGHHAQSLEDFVRGLGRFPGGVVTSPLACKSGTHGNCTGLTTQKSCNCWRANPFEEPAA